MKTLLTLSLTLITFLLHSQVVYNQVDQTYIVKANDMARIEFLLREGVACDSASVQSGREIDLLSNELNQQYGTIDSLLLAYRNSELEKLKYIKQMVRMDEIRAQKEKQLKREKAWGWVFKGATIILGIFTLAVK